MVERGYLESDNKRRWANYHIKGEKVDTSKSQKVDTSSLTKRVSKGSLELLIMDICNEKYVKMEVIAEQVGRLLDYLKKQDFSKYGKTRKIREKIPT